jgi:phosphoglycolate phosphatase-like HAD superfamily hydrolase
MIKNIFFDIDETLIHSAYDKPGFRNDYLELTFIEGRNLYTLVRPCADKIIQYARNLVGFENVYILTTATREYAEQVNDGAGWNFDVKSIFTREDLRDATRVGTTIPHPTLAHPNNVIIDNLPKRYNETKMTYIGISADRYFHVMDYYGAHDEDLEQFFYEDVVEFLNNANV